MRLEVAGAQITDAVVEVLDTLQNQPDVAKLYVETIDTIMRYLIDGTDTSDYNIDSETMERLRVMQMIRRDILAIATPPDVDDPGNDVPVASI